MEVCHLEVLLLYMKHDINKLISLVYTFFGIQQTLENDTIKCSQQCENAHEIQYYQKKWHKIQVVASPELS